jgi:hypothetical protein
MALKLRHASQTLPGRRLNNPENAAYNPKSVARPAPDKNRIGGLRATL